MKFFIGAFTGRVYVTIIREKKGAVFIGGFCNKLCQIQVSQDLVEHDNGEEFIHNMSNSVLIVGKSSTSVQ